MTRQLSLGFKQQEVYKITHAEALSHLLFGEREYELES